MIELLLVILILTQIITFVISIIDIHKREKKALDYHERKYDNYVHKELSKLTSIIKELENNNRYLFGESEALKKEYDEESD